MTSISILLSMLVAVGATTVTTHLKTFNSAIVYNSNKAEIERGITVKDYLAANQYHTVIVKGFSQNVIDETVRIRSTEDSKILDLKLLTTSTWKENTIEYKTRLLELNEKIADYNHQLTGLKMESSRYEIRLKSTEDFATDALRSTPSADGKTSSKLSVTDALAVLDFQEKEMKTCDAALLLLMNKINEINKNIAVINKEIEELKSNNGNSNKIMTPHNKNNQITKELTFRMISSREVNKEKPLHFRITYMSQTASWSPEYDVRIESAVTDVSTKSAAAGAGAAGAKPRRERYSMHIDYYANVWQRSGEHWTDISLLLSTSSPAQINTHSEPYRHGVSIQVPYVQSFGNSGSAGGARMAKRAYNAAPMMMSSVMEMAAGAGAASGANDDTNEKAMHGLAADSMVQAESVSFGTYKKLRIICFAL